MKKISFGFYILLTILLFSSSNGTLAAPNDNILLEFGNLNAINDDYYTQLGTYNGQIKFYLDAVLDENVVISVNSNNSMSIENNSFSVTFNEYKDYVFDITIVKNDVSYLKKITFHVVEKDFIFVLSPYEKYYNMNTSKNELIKVRDSALVLNDQGYYLTDQIINDISYSYVSSEILVIDFQDTSNIEVSLPYPFENSTFDSTSKIITLKPSIIDGAVITATSNSRSINFYALYNYQGNSFTENNNIEYRFNSETLVGEFIKIDPLISNSFISTADIVGDSETGKNYFNCYYEVYQQGETNFIENENYYKYHAYSLEIPLDELFVLFNKRTVLEMKDVFIINFKVESLGTVVYSTTTEVSLNLEKLSTEDLQIILDIAYETPDVSVNNDENLTNIKSKVDLLTDSKNLFNLNKFTNAYKIHENIMLSYNEYLEYLNSTKLLEYLDISEIDLNESLNLLRNKNTVEEMKSLYKEVFAQLQLNDFKKEIKDELQFITEMLYFTTNEQYNYQIPRLENISFLGFDYNLNTISILTTNNQVLIKPLELDGNFSYQFNFLNKKIRFDCSFKVVDSEQSNSLKISKTTDTIKIFSSGEVVVNSSLNGNELFAYSSSSNLTVLKRTDNSFTYTANEIGEYSILIVLVKGNEIISFNTLHVSVIFDEALFELQYKLLTGEENFLSLECLISGYDKPIAEYVWVINGIMVRTSDPYYMIEKPTTSRYNITIMIFNDQFEKIGESEKMQITIKLQDEDLIKDLQKIEFDCGNKLNIYFVKNQELEINLKGIFKDTNLDVSWYLKDNEEVNYTVKFQKILLTVLNEGTFTIVAYYELSNGQSITGEIEVEVYSKLPNVFIELTSNNTIFDNIVLKYSFDSIYMLTKDYQVSWYLDGNLVSNLNELVLTDLEIGNYSVELLVRDDRISRTATFALEVTAPKVSILVPIKSSAYTIYDNIKFELDIDSELLIDNSFTFKWLYNGNALSNNNFLEHQFTAGLHVIEVEIFSTKHNRTFSIYKEILIKDVANETKKLSLSCADTIVLYKFGQNFKIEAYLDNILDNNYNYAWQIIDDSIINFYLDPSGQNKIAITPGSAGTTQLKLSVLVSEVTNQTLEKTIEVIVIDEINVFKILPSKNMFSPNSDCHINISLNGYENVSNIVVNWTVKNSNGELVKYEQADFSSIIIKKAQKDNYKIYASFNNFEHEETVRVNNILLETAIQSVLPFILVALIITISIVFMLKFKKNDLKYINDRITNIEHKLTEKIVKIKGLDVVKPGCLNKHLKYFRNQFKILYHKLENYNMLERYQLDSVIKEVLLIVQIIDALIKANDDKKTVKVVTRYFENLLNSQLSKISDCLNEQMQSVEKFEKRKSFELDQIDIIKKKSSSNDEILSKLQNFIKTTEED